MRNTTVKTFFSLAFFGLLGGFLGAGVPGRAAETDFDDRIERVFPVRSRGELQVTNLRGDIVIEGWTQDRIRLSSHRRVKAENPDEAKRLLQAMDFTYRSSGRQIELSAEYGKNLTIEERLRERQNPRSSMDMRLVAPSGMSLRVWSVNGKVIVKNWNSQLEIRTAAGPIELTQSKGRSVSILCPECEIKVKDLKASLRCMGGSGAISLEDVKGATLYVETASGAVKASRIEGEQLYVSRAGAISGDNLVGHVEFHSQQGVVQLQGVQGFLSGRTESGQIQIQVSAWKFLDKALIESGSGNITLSLPRDFSGEVDFRSAFGRVESGFSVIHARSNDKEKADPSVSGQQIAGRVQDGGEVLRVFSLRGDVRVLKN